MVTFCGGEGCGKTTQIKLLKNYLIEGGHNVILTREPGGSPLAEKIRAMLLDPENSEMNHKTEFLLFLAARSQHIQDTIAPHLEKGYIVLCDRYYDSSYVYQHHARGIVNYEDFRRLNNWAITVDIPEDDSKIMYVPNLTFVLDVDVQVGHKRALARNHHVNDHSEARIDNEHLDFHTKVNEGFRIRATHSNRFSLIDANRTVNEIHESIKKEFDELYKRHREANIDLDNPIIGGDK